MTLLLALVSLFMTEPVPLEMPRAAAYLVRERGALRLEDRFERLDLWVSQTVIGRWTDEADRQFVLAALDVEPPAIDRDVLQTRTDYAAQRVPMKRVRATEDFPPSFRDAVSLLSPCAVADEPRAPRRRPRGYRDVRYWQFPTNRSDIVCTFRPEGTNAWFLATWQLAPEDDYPTQMEAFEEQFLRKEFWEFIKPRDPEAQRDGEGNARCLCAHGLKTERDLLRRDAHHSVAAYPNWHFTDAEEFAVLDDLPARGFVERLTNDFPVMRAKYASAIPSPLDGSNALSVVRIYASRDEYLDALEADGLTNLAWSAAYWSVQRRELVAHLSMGGGEELMRTIRHEAFHQYLSYATSMITVSPWFNEGYAQYFEGMEGTEFPVAADTPPGDAEDAVEVWAAAIPGVLFMDYEQFYGGSDLERRFKYRLAWSIAWFIEKGADEVRLKPFAGLKERYLKALVETQDMRQATLAAFKGLELLREFVTEWKKYWKKQRS